MTHKIEMKSSSQKRKNCKIHSSLGTLGVGLGLFLGIACAPLTAWSKDYTWDGADDNWNSAHWISSGTSGNDTYTIASGSVTKRDILILKDATVNLCGGTLNNGWDVRLSNVEFNMTSGAWNNEHYVAIGRDANSTSEVIISGGIADFDGGDLSFGHDSNAKGILTIKENAEVNIHYPVDIGAVSGAYGFLNIEGGTVNFGGHIYVGSRGTGELNISGGEITFSDSKKFYVGNESGSTGVVNIKPGAEVTFNTSTLQVGYKGEGTINVSGGEVTFEGTSDASFAKGGDSMGNMIVTGGKVTFNNKKSSGETRTVFGNDGGKGAFTLSGGEVTVNNKLDMGWGSGTASLNIVGSNVVLTADSMNVNNKSSANFKADENGFSTVNVTGTATISGNVTAGLGEASAIMTTSSTLLSANSLTVSDTNLVSNSLWNITKDGNSIVATLKDDNKIGIVNLANSISTLDFDATPLGWVGFQNANSSEKYALQLQFSGSDSLDDWNLLTDYYAELFDQYDSSENEETKTFTLFGLSLDDDSAFLWDLASYDATMPYALTGITSLDSNAVPEPATWAMLVIGVGVLVLGRRKR
ncbi:MAG: PEP-CTERM sorting domain-containing protein [Planctomycetia bacterium]|nr:PEP-CTERM sorting domain-containing protein [Planctomycetia bacterium]